MTTNTSVYYVFATLRSASRPVLIYFLSALLKAQLLDDFAYMSCFIRKASAQDSVGLIEMVKELLTHLGNDVENFSEARFLEDAFGDAPQFSLLIAVDDDDEYQGYALFHDSYEPSHAAKGVYLADLFVCAQARGKGIGKLLLQAVARDANSRGREFVWLVSPQEDARPFYDNIMDIRDEAVAYALTGEHFFRLVDGL